MLKYIALILEQSGQYIFVKLHALAVLTLVLQIRNCQFNKKWDTILNGKLEYVITGRLSFSGLFCIDGNAKQLDSSPLRNDNLANLGRYQHTLP